MLRAYVIDLGNARDTHIPLIEFYYINSHHTSIKDAPFGALYGHKYRLTIYWAKIGYTELDKEHARDTLLIGL